MSARGLRRGDAGNGRADLAKELRIRNPNMKIIFVSGYAEDAFEKNLPDDVKFNFLPKPFTLKQLVAAVKDTMAA
jgi:two-component system cell cycle sensor histidine kinase/response regulator CckA